MNRRRVLCIILTAPVWLVLGVLIASVYVISFPVRVLFWIVACTEYGFTGKWHDMWHDPSAEDQGW